jgi:hypothetical protein
MTLIDELERLDHQIEDLVWADEVEAVTCLECDRPLDDDELILGAFCRECRPSHYPQQTGEVDGQAGGRGRLRVGAEWVGGRLRHGYRRPR